MHPSAKLRWSTVEFEHARKQLDILPIEEFRQVVMKSISVLQAYDNTPNDYPIVNPIELEDIANLRIRSAIAADYLRLHDYNLSQAHLDPDSAVSTPAVNEG